MNDRASKQSGAVDEGEGAAESRRSARLQATIVWAVVSGLVWAVRPSMAMGLAFTVGVALAAWLLYRLLTRKVRRREKLRAEPFPQEWNAILNANVAFFGALAPAEKERFRKELQIFAGEKRITGIKTNVDETTRVLAACSAVIPIFGFPKWEWDHIREVLIYPSSFNEDFEIGRTADHRTLGMVGTGAMNGVMIFSKPELLRGFRNARDKRNVGIHEFAHLVDKSDGVIDGVPSVGLGREAVAPWIELVRQEMARMRRGKSDIDPYGLTNEAEFFAVVSEYFFERPAMLQREHPDLYAMLSKVFRQDMRSRAASLLKFSPRRGKLGRNSPCPCGSGQKYKRCCLEAASRTKSRRKSR